MFCVHISAPFLKAVLAALKEFADVVDLRVNGQGIEVKTLDETNVCFLHMHIPVDDLVNLEATEDTCVAVSVTALEKMSKSAKSEVKLAKADGGDVLLIEHCGDCGDLQYAVPLQMPREGRIALPAWKCGASVQMTPAQLHKLCNELKHAGQDTELTVDEESVVQFQTNDSKLGRAVVTLKTPATREEPVATTRVKFRLGYLQSMCKLHKICDQTTIRLPADATNPFQVRFASDKGSQFNFTLATMH